jgi:hypothetical protein
MGLKTAKGHSVMDPTRYDRCSPAYQSLSTCMATMQTVQQPKDAHTAPRKQHQYNVASKSVAKDL